MVVRQANWCLSEKPIFSTELDPRMIMESDFCCHVTGQNGVCPH